MINIQGFQLKSLQSSIKYGVPVLEFYFVKSRVWMERE